MRRFSPLSALALLAALVPAAALAGSVYLNGVRIDGVTNQKFEKATVRIDEKGDVHIEAAGYAVRMVTPPSAASAPAAAPAPVPAPAPAAAAQAPVTAPAAPASAPAEAAPARDTQRYWMVTEQTVPGMAEYDIDLFINSKWVRKLSNSDDQVIAELTPHLRPGKNTVMLIARKVAATARRSLSPEHVFRVIIGEGNVGGRNVMIDNPLIRFQRTAADMENVSEEFTLTTR